MTDEEMLDIVERLARLETEQRIMESQQVSIAGKLDTVIERFTRYEAKWGGVIMVISAILGLFSLFHSQIQKFLGGR